MGVHTCTCVIQALGQGVGAETGRPPVLTGQPNLISKLKTSERPCLKIRWVSQVG